VPINESFSQLLKKLAVYKQYDPYDFHPASLESEVEGVVAMLKSKTNFEQIPVKVVKRIARQESGEKVIERDKAKAEFPGTKADPYFVRTELPWQHRSEE
jgi:hypothetical protein